MRYSNDKEQRIIIKQLETAGWRIEPRSSHILAFPPDGVSRPVLLGKGQPQDWRTKKNMISNIEKIDPSLRGKIKLG